MTKIERNVENFDTSNNNAWHMFKMVEHLKLEN